MNKMPIIKHDLTKVLESQGLKVVSNKEDNFFIGLELDKVSIVTDEYSPRIKIFFGKHKTVWIDITIKQLEEIKNILLKGE